VVWYHETMYPIRRATTQSPWMSISR
jgi:hypothetical protein